MTLCTVTSHCFEINLKTPVHSPLLSQIVTLEARKHATKILANYIQIKIFFKYNKYNKYNIN